MGQSQSVPELSKVSSCQSALSSPSNVSSSAKRSCTLEGEQVCFPPEIENCLGGQVKVKSLEIYTTPLQSMPRDVANVPFVHHFLSIDVAGVEMPDGREGKGTFIKAEKGTTGERGKITVECEVLPPSGEVKRSYSLEGCGKIPMQKVRDILEEPGSDYNVWSKNCWQYAEQTFRALIREFSNCAEPGSETQETLTAYLTSLPVLRMPGDAFDLSLASSLRFGALALGVGIPLWAIMSYKAALAAWIAKAPVIMLPVAHGLGTPLVPSGLAGLQMHLKFAGAAQLHSAGVQVVPTHLIPVESVNAAIKLAFRAALTTADWVRMFVAAVFSPKTLLIVGGVVGVIFVALAFSWGVYYFTHGLKAGGKDHMGFCEFVSFVCRGLYHVVCGGFKGVFARLFQRSESPGGLASPTQQQQQQDGHTDCEGDTEPLLPQRDGHSKSDAIGSAIRRRRRHLATATGLGDFDQRVSPPNIESDQLTDLA